MAMEQGAPGPDVILGEGQMSKNLKSHRADLAFPRIIPKGGVWVAQLTFGQ